MRHPKILAIILAGGAGSRLDVLTAERAKPAVPFAGTYRLIDFALSNCMHSGLSDVWIIEQYLPHALNEHLANGRPWDLDRTYGGLQVLPPYVDRRKSDDEGGFAEGNADALYRNRAAIRAFAPDLLLVLSADHVYKLDYRDILDFHQSQDADVTMVTTTVAREEANRFGVVQVDPQGRVTDFAYKPEEPKSDCVTTEVFVYDAGALLAAMERLAERKEKEADAPLKDFGDELIPHLVAEGRARAYRFDGYWRDVGTVESYWKAHRDLLAPEPGLALDDPAWPILTYGTQRPPAWIDTAARIEDSLIAPGCRLHGRVERCVLAPGVVIEEGAVVRDSILLHETRIARGATVDCAILDQGCRVEADARIGQRPRADQSAASDTDITLLGTRTRIPAGAVLPAGSRVPPAPEGSPSRDGE